MAPQQRRESSIIKLVPLGPEAIEYLREELAHPDPLADALRQMPLEAGHVTTYMPSRASAEEVRDLRAAFRSSNAGGAQAYRAMREFVYRYLQQGGLRVLLMGSHPAKPADWDVFTRPRLGGLREWAERVTCEGRAYFCATESSGLDRVRDVFEDGQATTTFGVLARDLSRVPARRRTLTGAEMEEVVQQADHALVGAYDSAGTLIWSKPE